MFASENGDIDEIQRLDDDEKFEETKESGKIEALANAKSDVFYKPDPHEKVVFTDEEDDEGDKFAN